MKYPSFLESELKMKEKTAPLFCLLPIPFEKSVSYGEGCARAPLEILRASQQLERCTERSEPICAGIETTEPLQIDDGEELLHSGADEVKKIFSKGQIPIILGGEHSVSLAAFAAIKELYPEDLPGIVQIDAHADLRDSYEGSKLSHACVMHRAYDMDFSLFQIGVRSISPDERLFRSSVHTDSPKRLSWLDGGDAVRRGIKEIHLPQGFPEQIYLTIDIDGLDPSLFPATGTPEPGGLAWYQCLDMIRSIAHSRQIIGFDLVELAPLPGRICDPFAAARLVYEVMGIIHEMG